MEKKARSDKEITIDVNEEGKTIPLQLSTHIKILGVIMDENLNWSQQVNQVRKRATNVVRNLARTAGLLPEKSRRILYDSLAAPHFSYADVVWDGCLKSDQLKLQRVHNFAARTITGAKKFSSASSALKTLGMVPLAQKRQVHQAVLAHKLVNGKGPAELCNTFKQVKAPKEESPNIASRLRSSTSMTLPAKQHRTSKY